MMQKSKISSSEMAGRFIAVHARQAEDPVQRVSDFLKAAGRLIAEMGEARGMTLKDLAEKSGVNITTIKTMAEIGIPMKHSKAFKSLLFALGMRREDAATVYNTYYPLDHMWLGNAIRVAREPRHGEYMGLDELSKACGVDAAAIRAIEEGTGRSQDPDDIVKIVAALGDRLTDWKRERILDSVGGSSFELNTSKAAKKSKKKKDLKGAARRDEPSSQSPSETPFKSKLNEVMGLANCDIGTLASRLNVPIEGLSLGLSKKAPPPRNVILRISRALNLSEQEEAELVSAAVNSIDPKHLRGFLRS